MSFEEEIMEKLKERKVDDSENIEIEIQNKIDLNQIAQKNAEIEYTPEKFPGIVMKIENTPIKIFIFSNGRIVLTDLKNTKKPELLLEEIIMNIRKTGIKLDKKNINQDFEVDNIDYIILNILRDGQGLKPISTYEIRKIFTDQLKLEISQSTIHNRIKKLEIEGVILNYTVNFHPKKIGFKGKYLLRIKPKDPSKYNELALRLDMNKNITDLFRIGEQYGLFAIVRVKKIEDYATFIRDLYSSEEIEDTYTNFVLDELKPYTNFSVF